MSEPCNTPTGIPATFRTPDPSNSRCGGSDVPVPEVFTAPQREPAPPADSLPPLTPIRVLNDEVSLRCGDLPGQGGFGPEVVINGGALVENVWLQAFNLNSSQVRYVATLPDDVLQGLAAPTVTAEQIAETLKVSLAIATDIKDELEVARAAVQDNARTEAAARQDCQFGNAELVLTCPAGAVLTGAAPDAFNPVTVAAGTVLSRISQEAADQDARQRAEGQLVCRWVNAAITVTCQDLGFPDPVDNADGTVGTVTIAAGLFVSALSQADADAQARAEAASRLNCLYGNTELVLSCGDVDADLYEGVDGTPATPADVSRGETGNPVRVPARTFTSAISQQDADQQARTAALAALQCRWSNDPVTVNCPAQEYEGVSYPASDKSPVPTTTVDAGTVFSDLSKDDANELALRQAEFSLDCLYCNPEIPPRCIPESVKDRPDYRVPIPQEWVTPEWSVDATAGTAAGTVCGRNIEEVIPVAEQLSRVVFPVSSSKCRYINDELKVGCIQGTDVAGKFDSVTGAQLDPASFPPPFEPDADKRYLVVSAGSHEVYAATFDDIPASYFFPGRQLSEAAKAYANDLARNSGFAQLDCYFTNDTKTFTCKEKLNLTDAQVLKLDPQSKDNLTIAQGFYRSDKSKEEANQLRDTQGAAFLQCFFSSPAITLRCFQGINGNPNSVPPLFAENPDGSLVYGDGTADTRAGVNDGIVSAIARGHTTNPVVVPRGQGVSYISPEQALADALTSARGMLDCFWSNPQLTVFCGADPESAQPDVTTYKGPDAEYASIDPDAIGSSMKPVTVSPDVEISYQGRADAVRLGIERGLSQMDCFWSNDEFIAYCATPVERTETVPGVPNKYVVPARTSFSSLSKESANQQAETLGRGLLFCLYQNIEYGPAPTSCPNGMSVPKAGIPRGTVKLNESEAVKLLADLLYDSQGSCIDDTQGLSNMLDSAGISPEPGTPGPGPDCSGNCHGIYAK